MFLLALAFAPLYWRVGVFINDNYTLANALVNVANGHLEVASIVYGPESGTTPGMKIDPESKQRYARHYGIVFGALPFLWLYRAATVIADLRIALVGAWSLVVLALVVVASEGRDRSTAARLAGSVLVVLIFFGNVAIAPPLSQQWLAWLALQTSTLVWGGLAGVFTYRLVGRVHDRRAGSLAGTVVVVASPIAFWSTLPKRHVLVALLTVGAVYAFYRAREAAGGDVRFRALSYVAVGLCAWVSPFEAAFLLMALGPIDLLTARSNHPRRLAIVAGAFVVSLLPFAATNYLVTGSPVTPPALLPGYPAPTSVLVESTGGGAGIGETSTGFENGSAGGGTAGSDAGTDGTGEPKVSVLGGLLARLATAVGTVMALFERYVGVGIQFAIREQWRLYHSLVRGGYVPGVSGGDADQAINLALLEALPVVAVLVSVPVVVVRRLRTAGNAVVDAWSASAAGRTDVLVVGYVSIFLLGYLPAIPVHASITSRYLIPAMPLLLYGVVRVPAVREALAEVTTLGMGYAGTVCIGGQVLVVFLAVAEPSLGEAVQVHALIALASAGSLVAWAVVAALSQRTFPRVGAACLAIAAGATTVFVLLASVEYFAYAGEFLLPVSGELSRSLPLF